MFKDRFRQRKASSVHQATCPVSIWRIEICVTAASVSKGYIKPEKSPFDTTERICKWIWGGEFHLFRWSRMKFMVKLLFPLMSILLESINLKLKMLLFI